MACSVSWPVQSECCPGSPAGMHASVSLMASAAAPCASVRDEMLGRVDPGSGWIDPHNRGTYAVVDASSAASLTLTRVTGSACSGCYTDKLQWSFQDDVGGGSCTFVGCSESQGGSFLDYSTNYCNLRMLYCSSADGCTPVVHDVPSMETHTHHSAGASTDAAACITVVQPPLLSVHAPPPSSPPSPTLAAIPAPTSPSAAAQPLPQATPAVAPPVPPPSPTAPASPPDAPRVARPTSAHHKHAMSSVAEFWFWLPITLGLLAGGLYLARAATRDGSGGRRFWPSWLGARAWAELDPSRSAASGTSSTAVGVSLPPLVRELAPGELPPPPRAALPAALLGAGDDSPATPGADPLALWRAIEGDKQAGDALKEKQQQRQQRRRERAESVVKAQASADEARATGDVVK